MDFSFLSPLFIILYTFNQRVLRIGDQQNRPCDPRTIADLEGKENIEMHHVAEAVGYHSLDRGDWAER